MKLATVAMFSFLFFNQLSFSRDYAQKCIDEWNDKLEELKKAAKALDKADDLLLVNQNRALNKYSNAKTYASNAEFFTAVYSGCKKYVNINKSEAEELDDLINEIQKSLRCGKQMITPVKSYFELFEKIKRNGESSVKVDSIRRSIHARAEVTRKDLLNLRKYECSDSEWKRQVAKEMADKLSEIISLTE